LGGNASPRVSTWKEKAFLDTPQAKANPDWVELSIGSNQYGRNWVSPPILAVDELRDILAKAIDAVVLGQGSLGRYGHTIESWDNGTPYVSTEADSWGKRISEQGHKVTTIGKLHYRKVGDPSGFDDQRLLMHVPDGVGDVFGCLRENMPARTHSRNNIYDAGAGEVEYTRYDRAITEEAIRFLTGEGPRQATRGHSSCHWCTRISPEGAARALRPLSS
jgi:hypothetical protein